MKKINTYLTIAILALMATTVFSSCDRLWDDIEDQEEAYTLEGTWTGYIDTYLNDRFGLSGDSYRTSMYFERENSYGGWGYEVDYNMYSRYSDYYYCEFRWEVVSGTIRINYADSWNTVYIYDYTLTSNHFFGYMDDGTTRGIVFDMAYDGRFDWSYWTRGITRASGDDGKVQASGEFAKQK